MPMTQISKDNALTKQQFHRQLLDWIASSNEEMIGPAGVYGQTCWLYVRDSGRLFGLHVDTKRSAVIDYLQIALQFGETIAWEVVPNNRGNRNAVAYGPNAVRITSFYLYVQTE